MEEETGGAGVTRLDDDTIRILIASHASVDSCAEKLKEYGYDDELASETAMLAAKELIDRSPKQLQGSFAHCCTYWNLMEITRVSMFRGDTKSALGAQKEIRLLLSDVA